MGRIANNDARSLLTTLETLEPRLPARLIEGHVGEVGASGERRLMIALLADALGDFRRYVTPLTRRHARLFKESEAWFLGDMDGTAVPFPYVCEVLGLNASYFRSKLRAWRDRQRARGCPCERAQAKVAHRTRPKRCPDPRTSFASGPARWKRFLPSAWPTGPEQAIAAG